MKTGSETKQMISVRDLYFDYEKTDPVLKGVSFSAVPHEKIGIIGANGMGKSTLMKILVGLILDFSGEVLISNHEVKKENLKHVREHIGFVFQDSDSQLFLNTVEEDVAFGPKNYGLSDDEVKRRVDEAISAVHIEAIRKKQNYKLSGGEKKLASIATILSMEPDIIIMDEPSIALDPKNRRNLIGILNELSALKLITSHDLDFIMDTCDRVMLLDDGRIIADDKADVILSDKKLLEDHGLELPLSFQRRSVP